MISARNIMRLYIIFMKVTNFVRIRDPPKWRSSIQNWEWIRQCPSPPVTDVGQCVALTLVQSWRQSAQGGSAQHNNCSESRKMDKWSWQGWDVIRRWPQRMKMDDCGDADTDGRKVGWDPAPKQTATRNRNNGESRSHRGLSRQDEEGWKNKIKKNP